MSNYDKKNNDTYTTIYSMSPATDVEIHMFRDDTAMFIAGDGIRGNFSVQSRTTSANYVLQFPKLKDIDTNNLIKITDKTLQTIYPLSLINRYKLPINHLTYTQKTPIFYDNKKNKFIILLDRRFGRDVKISELNLGNEYFLYRDKNDLDIHYVGIPFDTVNDIKMDCVLFQKLLSNYTNFIGTLSKGEKVIVVGVLSSNNERMDLFGRIQFADFGKHLFSSSFNLEFFVAYRFGDLYYQIDDNDQIIRKSMKYIKKEKFQKSFKNETTKSESEKVNSSELFFGKDANFQLFITEYSPEQFNILQNIKLKLQSIHNELQNLFSDVSKSEESDLPVLELPSRFLKIENK